MVEQVVEVNWLGLSLREPMTFFTDLLVCIPCSFFYRNLVRKNTLVFKLWAYFFLLMGLSTLIAGFAHLLFHYTGQSLHFVGRTLTGVSIIFAELATIQELKSVFWKKVLRIIVGIQSVVFIGLLIYFQSFEIVKFNTIFGMIGIVVIINLIEAVKTKTYTSKMLVLGVLFSVPAAIVSAKKFSLHAWFTYHDIGHLIVLGSLIIIYLGLRKLTYNTKQL